ncbi:pneumococcal surface protein [Streptococcus pneumoniae]|nr:pneumococcal surface protein [Streptococcus pneumoniae]
MAKYYIILPKDAEIYKTWRGTVNIPIIDATKTTPELSYFKEDHRNYIANENKSGANYIEWKGTVEEFKETIKKLTDKKSTTATPKKDEKPTPKPDEKPKPTPTVQSGWVGSSYYQDGKKVISKWIFDKKYNSYFYLDASGNYVQNAWVGNYYLKSGGYMAKGEWVYDSSYQAWYYLKSDGSYAYSTWQGNYYLKSNGKMAKGEWIYDENYGSYYYLTSEGSYARNAWSGNYYLKSNGKMAKSEWVYDKNYASYYYLTSEGSYARNTWVGNYYLKSNGKMAKSEWVDGGRYYVGSNGLWETKSSTNSEYSAVLGKAKSYNSLFHMSKKRMYRQLTSDFDKFSNDAAQYAIDHLDD